MTIGGFEVVFTVREAVAVALALSIILDVMAMRLTVGLGGES